MGRLGLFRSCPEQEASVPVHVRPEAAERITALRLEWAVQAMLEYARKRVRRLAALEVVYHGGPDELGHFPSPLGIIAWIEPDSDQVLTSIGARWRTWCCWRFPGKVRRLFGFSLFYRFPGCTEPKWLATRG
jgi:hypothetical protein